MKIKISDKASVIMLLLMDKLSRYPPYYTLIEKKKGRSIPVAVRKLRK